MDQEKKEKEWVGDRHRLEEVVQPNRLETRVVKIEVGS